MSSWLTAGCSVPGCPSMFVQHHAFTCWVNEAPSHALTWRPKTTKSRRSLERQRQRHHSAAAVNAPDHLRLPANGVFFFVGGGLFLFFSLAIQGRHCPASPELWGYVQGSASVYFRVFRKEANQLQGSVVWRARVIAEQILQTRS